MRNGETKGRCELNLMVIGSNRWVRNAIIQSMCGEKTHHSEKSKPLNFATIHRRSCDLNLYGVPGDKRFAALWHRLITKVQGMVLIGCAGRETELRNLRFVLLQSGVRQNRSVQYNGRYHCRSQ